MIHNSTTQKTDRKMISQDIFALNHTCQDCEGFDELLMTFEAPSIPTRWLCASCYWKQIARYAYGTRN